MTKQLLLLLGSVFILSCCFGQDTTNKANASIFELMMTEMKDFKIDTSDVPDDKTTRKIRELRALKGVFNIDEAISFKLEEDRSKKEKSPQELQKLADYIQSGRGKVLLDNAITWIYRREFTYPELKGLVKFYKTSAGQKVAERFPLVMLKSLAAAQVIVEGRK
jgi:hypothetical protein